MHVVAAGPPGLAEAYADLPELPLRDGAPNGQTAPAAADFLRERRTGVLLYNAIFAPHILRLLEESRLIAGENPLPIDLTIDDDALVVLPWELLRDPDTDRFLALSESAILSRVAPDRGVPPPLLSVPSIGSLKVAIVAPELGEPEIQLAQGVGGDRRVDVSLAHAGVGISSRPHVVQISGPVEGMTFPESVRLLVVDGDARVAEQALAHAPAVVALPPAMTQAERATFLAALYAALAAGEAPDAAMTRARRAVARAHSATELDWALPILITRGIPQPVVAPPRAVAGVVGRKAKEETVGWVKSTVSGAVSSVVLFLVGLTLFRLGVSGSPDLSFSIISPYSLYASLKALVLELSTFSNSFLLIAAACFALLALASVALWRRRRRLALAPGQHDRWIFDILAPVSGLRSVSFFGMAALTILGAFAYQQYLWNVLLPIDDDALGIAITRDTAAATFSDDLADALFAEGQTREIVIRELPVKFDARDTDKARSMGTRIGAEAVIIYRAEENVTTDTDEYVAYVVFTDPTVGFAVPSAGNPVAPGSGAQQGPTLDVRTGASIPALRTEQLTELVDAAAGIIAYQEDRYRDAILHLREIPLDGSPDTGIVAYYLGRALDLDDQGQAAMRAYETAIAFYEGRQAANQLGPQDTLLLVDAYLQRGKLDRFNDDFQSALVWYQKGVALREEALARADDLERPTDVPATFARLYAEMADVYRITGDAEQQRFWSQRAAEEADAIAAASDDDDIAALNQEMTARFFAGDCVGALTVAERVIAVDPTSSDAYIGASGIAMFQGRPDLAEEYVRRLLQAHPDDVRGRDQLAAFYWARVISAGAYYDPTLIDAAEQLYRETLAIDPTNLTALNLLADASAWRASGYVIDLTALLADDTLTVAKSQVAWSQDPARVDAALAAYGVAIDQRRVIAVELGHGAIDDELDLADAYLSRQKLLYDALTDRFGQGMDDDMRADGEQLLADAAEIRRWTARAIAGGDGVTRLQQLRGWALLMQSIDREWGWYSFFAQDPAKVDAVEAEFSGAFAAALALVESAPLKTPDELGVGAQVYFSGALLATLIENDPDKGAAYQQKALELARQEQEARSRSTSNFETICAEERERRAGAAAERAGNLEEAAERYAAALALNPNHLPTLLDAASLATRRDDPATAAMHAEAAVKLDPRNAAAWSQLAIATLILGDGTRSDTAWERFLEVAATYSPQKRMFTLSTAVRDLTALVEAHPELSASVAGRIQPLVAATEPLEDEAADTYQMPALYAAIGRLALWAAAPEQAEPLFAKSLEHDPHQPTARAWLALAAIARGRDAAPEIELAIAETRDPFWSGTYIYDGPTLLDMLEAEIDAFVAHFPHRSADVQDFRDAIAAEREHLAAASG